MKVLFTVCTVCVFSVCSGEGIEILSANCDCRDWYGGCRGNGDRWIDDGTWIYSCNGELGEQSNFVGCQTGERSDKKLIPLGANETINDFWFSCTQNTLKLKYEEEPRCLVNGTEYHVGQVFRDDFFQWICLESGRWVTGCFYQNETEHWVLLRIGETGYNGLVKHTCDRYDDHPGRVQYYAEVRKDVPVKHPPNKGKNRNLPELVDHRLKETPIRWLHSNVAHFITNRQHYITKIRYIPDSADILSNSQAHQHSNAQ